MRLSVSLPEQDAAYLAEFARSRGLQGRSAAVQALIRLVRESEVGDEYEAAWDEWSGSGEAEVWDAAIADGVTAGVGGDATR